VLGGCRRCWEVVCSVGGAEGRGEGAGAKTLDHTCEYSTVMT
jgi:hypothetical protein